MGKVDQKLMTQAEYARHRGCSREGVRRAVQSGRISAIGPDKLIDPAVADIQWASNTRARASSAPPAAAGTNPATNPATAPPGAILAEPDASVSYLDWRTRREAAEAMTAELALLELRGVLVRAADVKQALSRSVAALRESFLQLPARLVPLLAADPAAASMDRILRAEIVAALAGFVESVDRRDQPPPAAPPAAP
jgi:hypothetical protein